MKQISPLTFLVIVVLLVEALLFAVITQLK